MHQIAVTNILTTNFHQGKTLLPAELHQVVADLQLVHELLNPVELLVDLEPGDHAGVHDIILLEDDQTVRWITVHSRTRS